MKFGQRQMVMALAVLLAGLSISAMASPRKNVKRPLHFKGSTAVAKGFVGGENIDTYTFSAKKGQVVSVMFETTGKDLKFTISGPGETVLVEADETGKSRRWEGEIPRTGQYAIDVTSNPEPSHYTLTVVRKQAKPTRHPKKP